MRVATKALWNLITLKMSIFPGFCIMPVLFICYNIVLSSAYKVYGRVFYPSLSSSRLSFWSIFVIQIQSIVVLMFLLKSLSCCANLTSLVLKSLPRTLSITAPVPPPRNLQIYKSSSIQRMQNDHLLLQEDSPSSAAWTTLGFLENNIKYLGNKFYFTF